MPDVGSSRKTTREPPMRAIPTDSFRFCPPDSVFVSSFSFSVRPTSFRVACFVYIFIHFLFGKGRRKTVGGLRRHCKSSTVVSRRTYSYHRNVTPVPSSPEANRQATQQSPPLSSVPKNPTAPSTWQVVCDNFSRTRMTPEHAVATNRARATATHVHNRRSNFIF